MTRLLIVAVAFAFYTGCSTAKVRVMPGENGINKVVASDIEKDDAAEAATEAATKYCDKKKKSVVFLSDNTKYTGSMNEDTRNTVRKASKVAQIVGFQTRDQQPGTLGKPSSVETAGDVGAGMTNDRDYTAEMSFKCQ